MTQQAIGGKSNFKLGKQSLELWGTPQQVSKGLQQLEGTFKEAGKSQTKITLIFGIPVIVFILGAVTWTTLESGKHEGPILDHVDGRYVLYALGGFFAWVLLGIVVGKVLELLKPHQNWPLKTRQPTIEKFHQAFVNSLPTGSSISLKWSLLPFRSGVHKTLDETLPKEGLLGPRRRQLAWQGPILEGELTLPNGTRLAFQWSYRSQAIAVYEERDYNVGRQRSSRTDWFYDSDRGQSISQVSTTLSDQSSVSDFGQNSAPQGKPDPSMVWDFEMESRGRVHDSKLSADKVLFVEGGEGLPLHDVLAHLNWAIKESGKEIAS